TGKRRTTRRPPAVVHALTVGIHKGGPLPVRALPGRPQPGRRCRIMTEQLLDALLLAYFRREVTQKQAAKLLEMRTAEFSELATGWAVELFERAIKANADEVEEVRRGVEWRLYLRRFLATFPECDPRACRRDTLPAAIRDDLFRPVP